MTSGGVQENPLGGGGEGAVNTEDLFQHHPVSRHLRYVVLFSLIYWKTSVPSHQPEQEALSPTCSLLTGLFTLYPQQAPY